MGVIWRFSFYCCFIDLQAFTLWLKELKYIHYSGFGMDLVWVGEFQIWPFLWPYSLCVSVLYQWEKHFYTERFAWNASRFIRKWKMYAKDLNSNPVVYWVSSSACGKALQAPHPGATPSDCCSKNKSFLLPR